MHTNNINIAILLVAISSVESNHNDAAVGKAGERGRYQIMATTWRDNTAHPHVLAHDWRIAEFVAHRHIYTNIIPALSRAKREITVYNIAACWNAGIRGFIELGRGHAYADKVVRAYSELEPGYNVYEPRDFAVSP
jgi:muramidase (phage lysozyme)